MMAVLILTAACEDSTSSVSAAPESLQSTVETLAPPPQFAVLALRNASCNGAKISGAIGTFHSPPTGRVSMFDCPLDGSVHLGDLAAQGEFFVFGSAYGALTPRNRGCSPLNGSLDGRTLLPGTYCFDSSANLTGVLKLTGSSTSRWTFKIGTSGNGALVATNFSVVTSGGADACNVTWWVRDGATITTSSLQGNVLARAEVIIVGGAMRGSAYSQDRVSILGQGTEITSCKSQSSVR
jgi:hypothetical protein